MATVQSQMLLIQGLKKKIYGGTITSEAIKIKGWIFFIHTIMDTLFICMLF